MFFSNLSGSLWIHCNPMRFASRGVPLVPMADDWAAFGTALWIVASPVCFQPDELQRPHDCIFVGFITVSSSLQASNFRDGPRSSKRPTVCLPRVRRSGLGKCCQVDEFLLCLQWTPTASSTLVDFRRMCGGGSVLLFGLTLTVQENSTVFPSSSLRHTLHIAQTATWQLGMMWPGCGKLMGRLNWDC